MTESPWGPAQDAIDTAVADAPETIADVVDQLTRVQSALDRLPNLFAENPVADFNTLYTTITRQILLRHEAGGFEDAAFLNRLDIEFATRYFDALRLWGANSPATPYAWSVLFRRYNDDDLRSLPCAAAGVNAHINYDLPFALVATWERLGYAASNSPQHRDYLRINEIFFRAIPGLRRRFLSAWQRRIDRINGNFDDWYQNFLVEFTRDRAWSRAQRIWPLRKDPGVLEEERSAMDHHTAALGQFLLSPFCSLLQ